MFGVGVGGGFSFHQLHYVCTFLCVSFLDSHLVNQNNREGLEWWFLLSPINIKLSINYN